MMTRDHSPAPALTHPIVADTLKLRTSHVAVVAAAAELPEIARALGLASVEALAGEYDLSRNGERVKVEGHIEASFHQICIVSLDAFPVSLTVPITLDFVPRIETDIAIARAEKAEADGDIDIEVRLDEDDPPEAIVDGIIDLGAVTLEFLALALDPYPRKPGVSFEASAGDQAQLSPFAMLARLKSAE